MSAETKRNLETAIAAHVADEQDGATLTGFILQTAAVTAGAEDFDRTSYLAVEMQGQPFHVGLGLTHFLLDYYTLPDEE